MIGIIAYEMEFTGTEAEPSELVCVPFGPGYFDEYMQMYNECFYDMRKALEVKPYAYYSEYSQIQEKAKDIFLYIKEDEIVGSVACFGNEIDDLVVRKAFQGHGYGSRLLLWAMGHIRENNQEPITLHVAEWNQKAFRMYEKAGFVVKQRLTVR